jgi:hypothetical protein
MDSTETKILMTAMTEVWRVEITEGTPVVAIRTAVTAAVMAATIHETTTNKRSNYKEKSCEM